MVNNEWGLFISSNSSTTITTTAHVYVYEHREKQFFHVWMKILKIFVMKNSTWWIYSTWLDGEERSPNRESFESAKSRWYAIEWGVVVGGGLIGAKK